jgi:hypothetical protein
MEANETNNLDKTEAINLDKTDLPATPASREDEPVSPIQDTISPPARPKGPNAAPVVLGLVALVLAALVIAEETMNLTFDWSRLGPAGIITIGVVMALIGGVGLVRRHDDL